MNYFSPMTKPEARLVLEQVRCGLPVPQHLINRSLIVTGDLTMWSYNDVNQESSIAETKN